MKESHGDLLQSEAKFIVHQCNSHGVAGGLAGVINRQFPHADIIRNPPGLPGLAETNHPKYPGNIIIKGNDNGKRLVICLMGQFYPGGPAQAGSFDDAEHRARWFGEALGKMEQIPDLESVAFPFQIGCGIAGGNWVAYRKLIADFAQRVQGKGVTVEIIDPNPPMDDHSTPKRSGMKKGR
jgi:O-acetyl-ADP-ribose deacetylase (regulator of RNase III)